MPLKRSFFNSTLFFKNLSRSWPLWGGVTAVGSLVPMYLMLASMNISMELEKAEFNDFLYLAAVYFLPAFTFCYAILVAMFVWSYLHNSRSVGMMHSLAIGRTGLFVTNALSGLAMLLIPYIVVGGLLCLFAACHGALDAGAVLLTIAAVLLENLLFFGMATLCAIVTGSVIVTAAYYAILNFAVPVLDWLINSLAQEFIFGLTGTVSGFSRWFSPLISLYDNVSVEYRDTADVWPRIPYIENFSTIVAYGIVGIAMLALSWYLYRSRRSESAGDVVAFKWLRPVFRFGVAAVSGLTLGPALYAIFWVSLFYEGGNPSILLFGIWMAIGAVVGYYAASMLLEKTLRVFKGSLKGVGIVCAATAALCLAMSLDLFGVEKYVPNANNVASVQIGGYTNITCDAEKMPELLDDILVLHEAIIADKDYIRASDPRMAYNDGGAVRWGSILFTYTLNNGSQVERYYYLPLTEARINNPNTYDGKLYEMIKSPQLLVASVTLPEDSMVLYAYVEGYSEEFDAWEHFEVDAEAWETVYNALLLDAAEGNFVRDNGWWFDWEEQQVKEGESFFYDVYLSVEYRTSDKNAANTFYDYDNLYLRIQPTMKHTLNALMSTGVLNYETIGSWKLQK